MIVTAGRPHTHTHAHAHTYTITEHKKNVASNIEQFRTQEGHVGFENDLAVSRLPRWELVGVPNLGGITDMQQVGFVRPSSS